jgi:hypothetical protein
MSVYFIYLAGCAAFDVLCDKVVHAWPPIVGSDCVNGFCNTGVSCGVLWLWTAYGSATVRKRPRTYLGIPL